MSNLVPSNKRNHLSSLDNLVDSFFKWTPIYDMETFKVDVREEIKHYIVEAELPGIDKKDVDLDFHDGRLNIIVNQTEESDEESKNYIHKERYRSSAQRSVYLADATGEGITAGLDNGLLRIEVPKADGGSHRKKIVIK